MQVRQYKLLHAPVAADSMAAWIRRYLEAQAIAQISATTIRSRCSDLGIFHAWCLEREIATPREVSQAILERFQKHLFYLRKPDGRPLAAGRQQQQISNVRLLFRWLTKKGHLPADPASGLELPRVPRGMLPEALTMEEVERVLAVLDLSHPYELRDRAVLEVMYSTGIRRMEVRNLSIYDLDPARGTLFVRQGKGRKDRVVPIGERALAWVAKYQDEVRPHLSIDPKQTALFLSARGGPLSLTTLTYQVRVYFQRAGITKAGACHLLRHTMATLMLENGADIRYIQEMLGHASLESTEIYTHVSIAKLKQIHTATHPGARLARRTESDIDDSAPAA
jgi:integrase/recombinase XerD